MWEGSFEIIDKKKQKINVRLELLKNDSGYTGIIYSRGVDKSNVYGCDYVVSGSVYEGRIRLFRKSLLRALYLYEWGCESFEKLELVLPKDSSLKKIKAKWRWQSIEGEDFLITKKAAVISETAKEELDTYWQAMYESFEKNNVLLPVQKRLPKIVAELEVDSSDVTLEFSSVEQSLNDSIEISINGEVVRRNQNVSKNTLRLQMKPVADSINRIVVISNSVVQPKLKIKLRIKQQEKVWEYTLEPSFTRNAVVLLKRRQ